MKYSYLVMSRAKDVLTSLLFYNSNFSVSNPLEENKLILINELHFNKSIK